MNEKLIKSLKLTLKDFKTDEEHIHHDLPISNKIDFPESTPFALYGLFNVS